MCIDSSNKIPMDLGRRLAAIMWLSNVMAALLNLWEEMREPSENEVPLFSKQPYSSSTWGGRKSWCVLWWTAAFLRIDRIERISWLEGPKPSTGTAPPFKQPLDSNRKCPMVSLLSTDQQRQRDHRSLFSRLFSHGSPSYKKPFAEHHYPPFDFFPATYLRNCYFNPFCSTKTLISINVQSLSIAEAVILDSCIYHRHCSSAWDREMIITYFQTFRQGTPCLLLLLLFNYEHMAA